MEENKFGYDGDEISGGEIFISDHLENYTMPMHVGEDTDNYESTIFQDNYSDLFSESDDEEAAERRDTVADEQKTAVEFKKEMSQLILLSRHLESLQERIQNREFNVVKTREELTACRLKLSALEDEREKVKEEIATMKKIGNMASSFRLVSRCEKLTTEILLETKVESIIKTNLKIAELALSEVALEHRHYMNLSDKVEEQKNWVNNHRQKMAKLRLQKENKAAVKELKQYEKLERAYENQIEEAEAAYVEKMEAALLNNVKARKFLQISLEKIKQNQHEASDREKFLGEKRMRSIVELKKSINLTQENLKALQARNASLQAKSKHMEEEERLRVLNEGGNPDQVILQRKSLKRQENLQRAFVRKKNSAELQIVEKILAEELRIKERKKQQPQLWPTSSADHRMKMEALRKKKRPVIERIGLDENDLPIFFDDKVLRISEDTTENSEREQSEDLERKETDTIDDLMSDDILSSKASLDGRLRALIATQNEMPQKQELAKPEFNGLWTKKHKNYDVPKDNSSSQKPAGGSKMECDILKKTLNKHREGITVKQVAAGREFKGQPFYSNPDVIHFKDFDVGKSYKKKIVITNVSYTMNFCKFIGVSEHLKDFISVEFKPPGQMSAGMSCDMHVTFKPKINQDLEGHVQFMAQTGAFSLPLKCSTKKCDLCLDVDFIDFGSQVVGETICRSVQLINKGALGTRFEFFKVPDKPATTYTTETSLGRLTTAETVAMTPVDESDFMKTATTYPQEANAKQQRRQTTKEGLSTAAFTFSRQSETPGVPFTEENDRIKEMKVDIIEETTDTEREMMRSEVDEIKFASTVTDYSMLPEEIKVGQTMSGEIAAFSSVRLDVIFAPTIPGTIKANFRIAFSDKDSKPLTVKTSAKAMDVPVWIEKQTVDLRICMYDRLYQDQLIVRNRATTALRLNFEVPKELKNHVELLPKTGYIQAQSTFTAQLKFLPRKSLAEEAAGLFDPETNILEAPMVIHVADQTRPIPFTVTAIVTLSKLEFERSGIDFGECGIYESVTSRIKLTNHSILPQEFGFVDIPDYVEVQPNDGFGTILPLETIELDIILSVDKARVYDFQLVCKNSIGNEFFLRCKAVGVHPPMELTKQVINFAATALGDTSCAYLHVVNSHVSANEFTHPVPRIGKGEIVPVGPTSFEFSIPEGAPISITPTVGTVNPGEKCLITVHFHPSLPESEIREEAVRVLTVQQEDSKKREAEEEQAREQALISAKVEDDKTGRGKKSKTPARSKTSESGPPKSGKSDGERKSTAEGDSIPTPDEIEKDSLAYKAAVASLTRSHAGSFQSLKIPCFIARGKCDAFADPPARNYRPGNVLYMDIHCPTVKPPVVVISNHGQSRTEFGQVSIGQNTIKAISIQNISHNPVDLTLSSLDTNGPFQVLNALRTLKPDETHTLLVSFTPNAGKLSYEVLKVISATSVLSIPLTGEGVSPVINLSVSDGVLDLGHVLVEESATSIFTLSNSSSLKVDYSVRLDSCSLLRHSLSQQFPDYVSKHLGQKPNSTMLAGSQNFDGTCVFDCVPCEGTIATGESQEITVTFKPGHSSKYFSDGARIVLFNSEEAHKFRLVGQGRDHMMYLSGYEPLDVGVESLTAERKMTDLETDASPPAQSVLVTFQSKIDGIAFPAVTRQLDVGCLRTNAFVTKKNGEWLIENLQHAQSVGFLIDQPKGVVDVGATKPIDITWNPPEGHDPSVPIESTITLTLKADVPLVYNVLLRALLILH